MLSEEEKKRQEGAISYCAAEDDGDGSSRGEEDEEDSMISDAASRAPASALLPAKYKGLKKLKKAFKALDHDDSLEDTASSPVNSPKVSSYCLQGIILPLGFYWLKLESTACCDVNLFLFGLLL